MFLTSHSQVKLDRSQERTRLLVIRYPTICLPRSPGGLQVSGGEGCVTMGSTLTSTIRQPGKRWVGPKLSPGNKIGQMERPVVGMATRLAEEQIYILPYTVNVGDRTRATTVASVHRRPHR